MGYQAWLTGQCVTYGLLSRRDDERVVLLARSQNSQTKSSVHGRIIGSFRPGRFEPVAVSQAGEAGVVRRIGGPISAAAIPDMASANAERSRAAR